MSQPTTYRIGRTVVVDWPLVDLDEQPILDATVTGTVTRPDGTTGAMTSQLVGTVYRLTYVADQAGSHVAALTATGSATDAEQVSFYVSRSLVAADPPTLDPATEIGQVRLLIADTDEAAILLTDAQLTGFMTLEAGVKRAAAAALEAIAVSELLVSKVIRTQDLSTDGAKVSAELRARAKDLRAQADADDDREDGGLTIIDYVNPCLDPELAIWRAP